MTEASRSPFRSTARSDQAVAVPSTVTFGIAARSLGVPSESSRSRLNTTFRRSVTADTT
ncbi:hypothetical protein ACFQU9_43060 [Actinomadura namibiensis]|uniref:hypothetical protein n=1 Tax=Actinomadura kijaniata TaxID=46161 RepID=UPI00360C4C6B